MENKVTTPISSEIARIKILVRQIDKIARKLNAARNSMVILKDIKNDPTQQKTNCVIDISIDGASFRIVDYLPEFIEYCMRSLEFYEDKLVNELANKESELSRFLT